MLGNDDDIRAQINADLDNRMRELNEEFNKKITHDLTAQSLARLDAQIIYRQRLEEAKHANLETLAVNQAKEVTSRQGQILNDIIADINEHGGNSVMRKAYACSTYGKDIAPGINSNHCLIVQMAALNKANTELGPKISEQLAVVDEKLQENNILQIKTRQNQRDVGAPLQAGVADTLGLGANFRINDFLNKFGNSEYMENVDVHDKAEQSGYADFKGSDGGIYSYQGKLENKNIKLSSYIDENGYVKKDENGNPLLKDGDFAFIQSSYGNENSSGFHAIRINVDENNHATFTAGNNERINATIGSYYLNASCAVFHTQDYVADCIREQYKDLNHTQIATLVQNQYPDQVVTVDNQAIYEECYKARLQQHMEKNQERKQQAVQTASSPQLSPAEKVRMLQMGKSVQEASKEQLASNNPTPVNNNQTHRQGFNMAAYQRIAALRARIG